MRKCETISEKYSMLNEKKCDKLKTTNSSPNFNIR